MPDQTRVLRDRCIEHLQSKKAEELAVIDLRGVTDFADYFIICTGASDTQVRALADAVLEGAKAEGHRPWQVEGYDARKWVLIDFVDVVVHILLPETRRFYGLERLWGDAPIDYIEENADMAETATS